MPKPGHNRSFEYQKLLSVLTHEWVNVEGVIETITPCLQRGTCIRTYEDKSLSKGVKQYTEQDRFRMGARILINAAINSANNAGNIQVRVVGSRRDREIRLNIFDAAYIDQLLAAQGQTNTVEPELPETTPTTTESRSTTLQPILLDHRSVKSSVDVRGHTDTGQVQMTIHEVIEATKDTHAQDLHVFFTPSASDYLSDQLGFQGVHVRNGQQNPRKALIAPTILSR